MNVGKFILNVVVAFIVYGVLYSVEPMFLMPEAWTEAAAAMKPVEEIVMPTMAYHLVQTIVVVWLFTKAVGTDDMTAGIIFGLMIGLYLLATDSLWYTSLPNFPQATRMPLMAMHLVNGAAVGAVLAFMAGRGWGARKVA